MQRIVGVSRGDGGRPTPYVGGTGDVSTNVGARLDGGRSTAISLSFASVVKNGVQRRINRRCTAQSIPTRRPHPYKPIGPRPRIPRQVFAVALAVERLRDQPRLRIGLWQLALPSRRLLRHRPVAAVFVRPKNRFRRRGKRSFRRRISARSAFLLRAARALPSTT